MSTIRGIVESCLYVEHVPRAVAFYRDVLGLRVLAQDERMASLSVADRQLLLLFRRGATLAAMEIPGGVIPPHDGSGPLHIGLAVDRADLEAWEQRLTAANVAIESCVDWPRGGKSLYSRDPDDNLVELLTPGVWEIY
jgi:catechol 2,3-dioxygenase-like lactoylglutathione lyase family enzyme